MTNIQLTIGKYLNGEIKVLPPQTKEAVNQFVASNTLFAWIWGVLAILTVFVILAMIVRHVIISDKYHRSWDNDDLGLVTIFICGFVLLFLVVATLVCLDSAITPLQSMISNL